MSTPKHPCCPVCGDTRVIPILWTPASREYAASGWFAECWYGHRGPLSVTEKDALKAWTPKEDV